MRETKRTGIIREGVVDVDFEWTVDDYDDNPSLSFGDLSMAVQVPHDGLYRGDPYSYVSLGAHLRRDLPRGASMSEWVVGSAEAIDECAKMLEDAAKAARYMAMEIRSSQPPKKGETL